jgi:hypothetical protein
MNLALRDIRHRLGRFLITGVGLLLSVALAMVGIYQGVVAEALALTRSLGAELWVVERGTRGPFAEASRIPGDVREIVARVPGVADAGAITLRTAEMAAPGRIIRAQVMGYEPGRPGGPSNIAAGRAARLRGRRRGRRHRYGQCRDRSAAPGRRRRCGCRHDPPLEASLGADGCRAIRAAHALGRQPRAGSARHVHGGAALRHGRDHRADHRHDDDGQAARDRHPQAHRRA